MRIADYNYPAISEVELPHNQQTLPTVVEDPHLYAILINGGGWDSNTGWDNNYLRFWNNLSAMYCTLTEQGFQEDKIYVHSNEGDAISNFSSSGRGLDLDKIGSSVDIDFDATLSSVNNTFTSLQNLNLGPQDKLFIFTTGHGGPGDSTVGSVLGLWDADDLTSLDLKTKLDGFPNIGEIVVVMSQCHSGGFISRFPQEDSSGYSIAGPNRTIVTSVAFDEPARAELFITLSNEYDADGSGHPGLGYDEFAYYYTSALRGYYPVYEDVGTEEDPHYVNKPWLRSSPVGSFPFDTIAEFVSPSAFLHPGDYTPDNVSGTPTLLGAFQYADNWDTTTGDSNTTSTNYWNPLPQYSFGVDFFNIHHNPQYSSNGELFDRFQTINGMDLDFSNTIILSATTDLYNRTIDCTGTLILNSGAELNLHNNSVLNLSSTGELDVCSSQLLLDNSELNAEDTVINISSSSTFTASSSDISIDGTELNLSGASLVSLNDGCDFEVSGNSVIQGETSFYTYDPATGGDDLVYGAEVIMTGDRIEINSSSFRVNQEASITGSNRWDGLFFNGIPPAASYLNCDVSNVHKISVNNSNVAFCTGVISNCGQLTAINGSLVPLQDKQYINNDHGIYTEQSTISIVNCDINNNSSYGLVVNHPAPGLGILHTSNIVNNDGNGIQIRNANFNIADSNISSNSGFGYLSLGTASTIITGYINIVDNELAELFSIYDSFPTFSDVGGSPQVSIEDEEYDTTQLTYDKYLLMTAGSAFSPIDMSNCSIETSDQDRFYPSYSSYIFNDTEATDAEILFAEASDSLFVENYQEAYYLMKDVIEDFPETPAALKAIPYLPYINLALQEEPEDLLNYLATIEDSVLVVAAQEITGIVYLAHKDYINAIQYFEQTIANPPSDEKKLMAELDEAFCYYKLVVNGAKALPKNCTRKPRNSREYSQIRTDILNQLTNYQISQEQPDIPKEITLNNYPNPFNPTTTISFSIPKESMIKLSIYNIKGQKVTTLVNQEMSVGLHEIVWDGKNSLGKETGSGVYFYRLETSEKSMTKKMLLLK